MYIYVYIYMYIYICIHIGKRVPIATLDTLKKEAMWLESAIRERIHVSNTRYFLYMYTYKFIYINIYMYISYVCTHIYLYEFTPFSDFFVKLHLMIFFYVCLNSA
jgi:hypothetical protein